MSLYELDQHSDSTSVLPTIDFEKHPATHQQHEEERQDESQYPTGLKLIFIMASLMLGTTIMSLDTTIISVATPKISTQFHALDDVGWYGAAYLMTLTAITPVAANFYKYFNPKYVYLASIAIFEGTSNTTPHHGVNLTANLGSWLGCLCVCTHLQRLHHWSSSGRRRCRRSSSRSLWYLDLRLYSGKTSYLLGYRC